MRTNIETAFHARLYDWYGMIEGCASAGQCYFGNYHMNPECNYMEFLEQDGITRIVGTNLVNLAFPLIRYDTGHTCPCGRGLPHMKLNSGSITNLIRTGSGYKYFNPAYFNHTVRMNIKEFQIFQNSIDSMDLYLVPGEDFIERHFDDIKIDLIRFLGNDLTLNVHMVDRIERGPRGKYQPVICSV